MTAELAAPLLALRDHDRQTRERLRAAGRLFGTYDDEMQAVHRDNAHALDALVEHHGWPGLSLVGLEACRAAWLVAQHANCTPALQRKFLALMIAAAEIGEVPARQVAMLTDRVRFNEGRPQVYGTVLDWDAGGQLSCTLEDPAAVDDRRRQAGLPPFHDDLAAHRQEAAAEGATPPADMEDYIRRRDQWFTTMGWR